jgi:aspartate/methionine/tyrosine aminotransferase
MNPLLSAISPSVIRAINDRKRPDAIDLGMGQPLLPPDMGPLRQALDWVERNGCPYSQNSGFPELRAAIAEHFRYPGLDTSDSAIVTIGSQEALYLAIKALLDPSSDEALVVGPCFPAYAKLCTLEGAAVREVQLDAATGFAADAERVLSAVGPQTRLILLASPNNPTARIWPEAELARLASGLLRSPKPIYLLVDEVYRDLYYTAAPPVSAARFYPRTLVASSLSKSCALTGLRLGWLLVPAEARAAILKVHQLVVSCAGTLAQRAALAIFAQPDRLAAHRPHYIAQQRRLCATLDELGIDYIRPEGTFYCLARLHGPWAADSMQFTLTLLERHNVVVIPGSAFGIEGFIRLSFVAPPEELSTGLARIAELLSSPNQAAVNRV